MAAVSDCAVSEPHSFACQCPSYQHHQRRRHGPWGAARAKRFRGLCVHVPRPTVQPPRLEPAGCDLQPFGRVYILSRCPAPKFGASVPAAVAFALPVRWLVCAVLSTLSYSSYTRMLLVYPIVHLSLLANGAVSSWEFSRKFTVWNGGAIILSSTPNEATVAINTILHLSVRPRGFFCCLEIVVSDE